MPSTNHEVNIVKNVKTIELLKAEIVSAIGDLFTAMVKNSEAGILRGLSNLILGCYFLGKRLGIPFAKLDEEIYKSLSSQEMQTLDLEKWFGDVSSFQQYANERFRNR
ncbi:MAG TPA: MazG-like family protein [Bacillota bacterium]